MRSQREDVFAQRRKTCTLAGLWTALMLGAVPAGAADTSAASTVPGSMFGVQTHMMNTGRFFSQYASYWDPQSTMPYVQKLGVKWVRDGVAALTSSEHAIVSTKSASSQLRASITANRQTIDGYYKLYDSSGVRVVFTIMALAPETANASDINADYLSYLTQMVVAHPSIYAVELHNEPSIHASWPGTPEEYVSTYRVFANAIHKARPDIKILGGGGSVSWWAKDFYTRALKAGMMDFVDGISIHAYNNGNVPPEVDASYGHGSYEDSLVALWQQMQQANTSQKPLELHFTELGYSSVPGSMDTVANDQLQAAYLSRLMITYSDMRARQIPLKSVEWYDLKNDGNGAGNMQYNFGLVNFDLSGVKPAFATYANIIKAFPDAGDLTTASSVTVVPDRYASAMQSKAWTRTSDGATIVPFWRLDQVKSPLVDFSANIVVTMPDAANVSAVTSTGACDGSQSVNFSTAGNTVKVNVTVKSCASWLVFSKRAASQASAPNSQSAAQ